jgi:hypothetical protein
MEVSVVPKSTATVLIAVFPFVIRYLYPSPAEFNLSIIAAFIRQRPEQLIPRPLLLKREGEYLLRDRPGKLLHGWLTPFPQGIDPFPREGQFLPVPVFFPRDKIGVFAFLELKL